MVVGALVVGGTTTALGDGEVGICVGFKVGAVVCVGAGVTIDPLGASNTANEAPALLL